MKWLIYLKKKCHNDLYKSIYNNVLVPKAESALPFFYHITWGIHFIVKSTNDYNLTHIRAAHTLTLALSLQPWQGAKFSSRLWMSNILQYCFQGQTRSARSTWPTSAGFGAPHDPMAVCKYLSHQFGRKPCYKCVAPLLMTLVLPTGTQADAGDNWHWRHWHWRHWHWRLALNSETDATDASALESPTNDVCWKAIS